MGSSNNSGVVGRGCRTRRIAITFALTLLLGSLGALSGYAEPSKTAIVFYGDRQLHEELWPALFQALREDLAAGFAGTVGNAALDQKPALLREQDVYPGIEFTSMVQVRLLGRCDVVPQAERPITAGPLGWVELVSGKIQPFIFIDCVRLAKFLGPATLGIDRRGRQQAMAQAIAHILVHEWIHLVTQSAAHENHGIMQTSLSVAELIVSPAVIRSGEREGKEAAISSTVAADGPGR